MDFLIYIAVFVIIGFLALGVLIPMYKRHYRATGSVINYNSAMSIFIYKVNLGRDELIERLKTKNIDDELTCTIDSANSVMTLSDDNDTWEYHYYIQESGDYSVLKLEQVSLIGMGSRIPYKLNPYMVRKLQAEMLPFSDNAF